MSWSSKQYSKFENERNRPIADLLAHIPTAKVSTATDIGCGPGNSTELLRARFPDAKISGMDSSANMIEAARERMPGVQFGVDDISTWKAKGPFDVILANASLQWVPDHETLFPALINKLAPGGTLAVQMPDNFEEPAHRLMRETAINGPWKGKLEDSAKRMIRKGAQWYYQTLKDQVPVLDIWRTTYHHPLAGGPAAVVEWFKGTGLRPYLDPLNENERTAFLAQYQEAIGEAYTTYPDGTVLLPFPRLFIVATRG
jgi:trans-aconitate 2-methyltransferase